MALDLIILIICSMAIAGLGLLIFSRDSSNGDNRRFALLSIALIAWTVFNYLSENASSNNLLFTRLTFLGGIGAIYFVINFMAYYPDDKLFKNKLLFKIFTVFSVIMVPVVFLPNFVTSVGEKASQGGVVNTGYIYYLFIVYIIYSIILLLIVISKQAKSAQSPAQKEQLSIVATGFIIYAFLAIFSNVLLPMLIDNWASTRFGPVFTLILVGVISFAIVKHHLFDIRFVVARSVAYALSITFVVILYTLLAFGVLKIFLGFEFNSTQLIIFALFSAMTALAFQPIKRFFDKFSNRLFYRDAYDGQELLNSVNSSLVSNQDLYKLLCQTAETITDKVKVEFCTFYIDEKASIDFHLAGTSTKMFAEPGWADLITSVRQKKHKIIGVDTGIPEEDLTRMRDLHIECILKMTSQGLDVGYVIVGQKRSGSVFSGQDTQVLEIIADEVAIAVQNALRFEEIAQFNLTLQKKIEVATLELQKSNEKLKALDEAKDEFISMASHQLRTPLTSVKGYISMLLEGDAGELNDQQKNFLKQSFFASQRMVYLIADLLNVSRLKTGKFVIETKPTYLPSVVESELEQLQETVKARGLEMVFNKPATFPVLELDEIKTRQVIMNFADNAIYYTPKGGLITVKLEAKPNCVEYTVTDTGIGVPKDDQHKLFTKFFRAGNARKSRPDGTGLGLFMAKKVIVAQGGAIIFKTTEGKGSTFGFSFPRENLEVTVDTLASTSS